MNLQINDNNQDISDIIKKVRENLHTQEITDTKIIQLAVDEILSDYLDLEHIDARSLASKLNRTKLEL
jgi:hypothetical protein